MTFSAGSKCKKLVIDFHSMAFFIPCSSSPFNSLTFIVVASAGISWIVHSRRSLQMAGRCEVLPLDLSCTLGCRSVGWQDRAVLLSLNAGASGSQTVNNQGLDPSLHRQGFRTAAPCPWFHMAVHRLMLLPRREVSKPRTNSSKKAPVYLQEFFSMRAPRHSSPRQSRAWSVRRGAQERSARSRLPQDRGVLPV
eukprot:scaffold285_cov330-Pavlova_lutheri.AAC.63